MIINMNGAKAPETPSPVLQEKTVTPETLPTVIGADEGYDGLSQVTVNPDSQLKAENIRSGKTIFGVEGAFVGEPQPTDQLDYTMITIGNTYSLPYTLAFGYSPVMEENPTRLTELDFTTNYERNMPSTAYVGYGNGLIATNASNNFPVYSSSYIPSVTNYKWYYKSGTIPSGEMKFYIQYPYSSSVNKSTHITGEGYLVPVLQLPYSTYYPIGANIDVFTMGKSEPPDVIPITVDTELVDADLIGNNFASKMFTLNVPEITFEGYGNISSSYTATKAALTYAFMPKQIVIS